MLITTGTALALGQTEYAAFPKLLRPTIERTGSLPARIPPSDGLSPATAQFSVGGACPSVTTNTTISFAPRGTPLHRTGGDCSAPLQV
jgi:hypothetical protein